MTSLEGARAKISVWIPVAFAGMGFVIGLVAGLSETPIVGTLLPLLFTVIGGGAGFFAIHKFEKSAAIGIALTLFSVAFLIGNVCGITRRTGISYLHFWAGTTRAKTDLSLNLTDETPPKIAVQLVRLRAAIQQSSDLSADEKQKLWAIVMKESRKQSAAMDHPQAKVSRKKSITDYPQEVDGTDTLRNMADSLSDKGAPPTVIPSKTAMPEEVSPNVPKTPTLPPPREK